MVLQEEEEEFWGFEDLEYEYDNWKEVPTAQKDLIWEDIQVFEFSLLIFFNSLNLLFTYNKT